MYPVCIRGAPQFVACALREKNIPGGHLRRIVIMQSRGDGLAGFAKADESDFRFGVGHAFLVAV